MKLEALHEFVVLVKHMNFSSAAKNLYCSQPGLSSHIQTLEKELGFALFDRQNARLTLTPAGSEFLKFAQSTMDAYEQALVSSRAIAKEQPPVRIRTVLPNSRACTLLSRVGDIPFVLVDQVHDEPIIEAFEKNRIDAGFSYDFELVPAQAARARKLNIASVSVGRGSVAICFMKSHPLAQRQSLRMSDLSGCTVRIYSGRQFDSWKDILLTLLGEDIGLSFLLTPLESLSSLSFLDLGEDIYICGIESVMGVLAQREDLVICTELEDCDLTLPAIFAYRRDAANERVAALAGRLGQLAVED
jgi:DNA-binding transcriptional LysR family regulator